MIDISEINIVIENDGVLRNAFITNPLFNKVIWLMNYGSVKDTADLLHLINDLINNNVE